MRVKNAIAILSMSAMMSSPAWSACDGAASQPDSRYAVAGGRVYDMMTNLTWQRCSYGLHWSDANGCGGVVRGVTWDEAMNAPPEGWRVPTLDELKSLIVIGCDSITIDKNAFPDIDPERSVYWSSTTYGPSSWIVDFNGGGTGDNIRDNPVAVRFVRSGRQ